MYSVNSLSVTNGTLAVSGASMSLSNSTLSFSGTSSFSGALALNSGASISMGAASASNTGLFYTRVSGDTEWRMTIDTDGQLGWGAGGASSRDTWLYRSGANILSLASSSRSGNGGTLLLGNMRLNTATAVTNTHLTINGSVNIGTSNTFSSSSTNYNLALGDTNAVSSSATRCFVGGSTCTVNGSYNFCYGDTTKITTTGSNNFAVCGAVIEVNGTTHSFGCGVMGSATITGSTNSFAIGASAGSIVGRTGCVIIGDNQSSGFSPGANNMFQCRFNGGAINTSSAAYWFSSDVNSNGVKLNYQGNSWGSIGSDSRLKNKLYEMDYQSMLNAIDKVPCYRYTYKHDGANASLRTGWFADEFNNAFKDYIVPQINPQHEYSVAHPDEEPINTYNFDDGIFVAYCGVKALKQKVTVLEQTTKAQQQTIDNQQQIIDHLLSRVSALEQK